MKQLKRILMVLMCVGVLMSVTACGRDGNADDNGAAGGGTTDNAGNSGSSGTGTSTGNGTNDATNGNTGNTGNNGTGSTTNKNGEGVMDEIGNDIKDGAEDVGDALDGNDNNR